MNTIDYELIHSPLVQKMIKMYGTTDYAESGFFILPDGDILDGSGSFNSGRYSSGRSLDHHELANFVKIKADSRHRKLLYAMKRSGCIRLDVNAKYITSVNIPNKNQINTILDIFGQDDLMIDLYDNNLKLVASESISPVTKDYLEWFFKYPTEPLNSFDDYYESVVMPLSLLLSLS